MDNNEPMGMGRVRVQFPWQEEKNQITPWIRLIQPHSGAGKGFHFIPEIGEEVLVGHESQNAEKPFVFIITDLKRVLIIQVEMIRRLFTREVERRLF